MRPIGKMIHLFFPKRNDCALTFKTVNNFVIRLVSPSVLVCYAFSAEISNQTC